MDTQKNLLNLTKTDYIKQTVFNALEYSRFELKTSICFI